MCHRWWVARAAQCRSRACLLLIPALLAAPWAHAQGPADASASAAEALAPVIVTAGKLDLPLDELPQAASIVTADTISQQAQTSVTDTLRQEPGIQFQVGGGPGQALNTRLRGFADTTLFVLDGITLNEGGTGDIGYLLGQLDPAMFQRIEVLRGPRATLYGADSTSGVISFTTLAGVTPGSHLAIEAGSLDWKKLLVGTADHLPLGEGSWSYSVNGSWVDSGGVNRWEFYRNGTLVARTGYTRGDLELGASFYGTDNEFQNADLIESIAGATAANYFAVQIPDPSDIDITRAGVVSLWLQQQLGAHLSQKLTIGGSGQDFSIVNGDTANGGLIGYYAAPYDGWTDPDSYQVYAAGQSVPVYQFASTYRTVSHSAQADYNLRYRTDRISAVLGATWLGQSYDENADAGGNDESQDIRSLYGDAALALAGQRLHLEGGARLDSYTAWADKATYSLGALYDLYRAAPFALSVFANDGTSFTQPTLDQLYNPTYGNHALTPENASTVEAGLRASQWHEQLTEALTLWHSYVDNVIAYDYLIVNPRVPGGYGEYANLAAERSQGIELSLAAKLSSHLSLTANYTRTDAYDSDAAPAWTFMVENARNMGNLGVLYAVDAFDLGTNLFLTDHRLRWAGDVWAPGYARLDLYGRYHLGARLTAYARVQNALDHPIVQILGFRDVGVYVTGGLRYQF
ncbi:MAG TPA: TonB-dependent receptor [Steroidobacteraceae bacterium]|nr:TonB-dependent receptor [Steroidobacteraceae bacterium]